MCNDRTFSLLCLKPLDLIHIFLRPIQDHRHSYILCSCHIMCDAVSDKDTFFHHHSCFFAMNRQGKWDESPFHCRCHSSGRMSGNAETGKLGDRRKYDFVLYFNLHVYRRSWHRRGKSVCRLLENSECGSRSPDSAKSVKTSDRDIMTEEKRQLCSDLERSSTSLRSSRAA